MKVILSTESPIAALRLRNEIVKQVSEQTTNHILTWSYLKSADGYDILYHDAEQFVSYPERNVLFRIQLDGANLYFSTAWWKNNPRPSEDMFCLHVGRLVEMLLTHFRAFFGKLNIIDY